MLRAEEAWVSLKQERGLRRGTGEEQPPHPGMK